MQLNQRACVPVLLASFINRVARCVLTYNRTTRIIDVYTVGLRLKLTLFQPPRYDIVVPSRPLISRGTWLAHYSPGQHHPRGFVNLPVPLLIHFLTNIYHYI
ncbi:hypothetical protein B0J17DRAFT_681822, partial [Rhizoctonia solani]